MMRIHIVENMGILLLLIAGIAAVSAQYFGDYTCENGRDVIVNLFEWKWSDIENNCQRLADIGYCAVQVSPQQEHAVYPDNVPPYPWWQRYQPVSYIVTSRSGDEAAFQSMVTTCNNAGVKIYADAVINHMTGSGSGTGSAGSSYNAGDDVTNIGQDYPAVPYSAEDFHGTDVCFTETGSVEDYQDPSEVRNCRLVGLRDLRLEAESTGQKVADYLQKLVDWGVSGFRVDASKYMDPVDLEAIYAGLQNPDGSLPFLAHEVLDHGGEPIKSTDYTHLGRVMEFRYGIDLAACVTADAGRTLSELDNIGEPWGYVPSSDAVAFVDNHDSQRGHWTVGPVLTHKDPQSYKIGVAFTLAWDYGYPRLISSYAFNNSDAGPPSDESGNTNDVDCSSSDWVCEHEWPEIRHMVAFHNTVTGEPVANWWDNGNMAIAFSRGSKGFLFINKEAYEISQSFQTGLPAGEYCDVISCDGNLPPCGGAACAGSITVDDSGSAVVTINNNDVNPMRAYHV